MAEKVVLPKEVAEGIAYLRSYGYSNYNVFHSAEGALTSEPEVTIRKWAFDRGCEGSPDLLMQALVNGYDVEKSPEEILRVAYEDYRRGSQTFSFRDGRADGIRIALNVLGITIEGIND